MSFLRGSANYVWCTTSVLGKGATGAVFQGVNKHNGETVAVKTFNQLSHMRPQEVQMREFEVLQKVKHENIVKLLAIEEEQEGRGKVIVMELCTGGSLFNLLDDPENNFGLDEDEWLLVLSHLSAGMNHLRDNNLVHRDLKPGNIMKFINEDGSITYKLTDFGAARELLDDQQFVSLYGTEEYLHPDMYERAVLRKPVGKTFGATVDLWSIGVTLYHLATGNLPFRPFGGRRNKETMYYITTKKASGVISGVQTSENGPIQWSRELPTNCLLSGGIKKHITPLLAGLLEVNPQRMWTFDKFFTDVTRILSKKKLHLFYTSHLSEHRVYLDKEENLDTFQLLLTDQVEVEPASQILIFDKMTLSHYVTSTTPGTRFPDTDRMTNPIVCFNKENHNIAGPASVDLPSFPSLPNLVSVENDATLAKSACAVGYAYQRKIEFYGRCYELVNKSVAMLCEVMAAKLDRLFDSLDKCQTMTSLTRQRVDFFQSAHTNLDKVLDVSNAQAVMERSAGDDEHISSQNKMSSIVSEQDSKLRTLAHQLSTELSPAITQLHRRCVLERSVLCEWESLCREVSCVLPKCAARSRTLVLKLRESWQHLLRDRASRTLTYNDEQFHILEKIKMTETIRVLVDLFTKEVQPAMVCLTELLADWYKMAQTIYLQTDILIKDLGQYQLAIDHYNLSLKQAEDQYSSLVADTALVLEQRIKQHLQDTDASNQKAANHRKSAAQLAESKQVRRTLRAILCAQDEVWGILRENSRLIEQFGNLAMASNNGSLDNTVSTQQILAELELLKEDY